MTMQPIVYAWDHAWIDDDNLIVVSFSKDPDHTFQIHCTHTRGATMVQTIGLTYRPEQSKDAILRYLTCVNRLSELTAGPVIIL